jgi:hypothetical protein
MEVAAGIEKRGYLWRFPSGIAIKEIDHPKRNAMTYELANRPMAVPVSRSQTERVKVPVA